MTEQECLSKMVAPGTRRPGKYRQGVIQIWVTRACDKACFNCTQASNLGGKPEFISVEQFRDACRSLRGYFGVVGMFGGNPAMHPEFHDLCQVMREEVPAEQRGVWSNNPITLANAKEMARTFDPFVSNLNVHLDGRAYALFKEGWPECSPVGLGRDSRHSPVFVAMKDVVKKKCPDSDGWHRAEAAGAVHCMPCPQCGGTGTVPDESRIWELISGCDINQHWSAMIGVFRGQLRAWFCEVAGAQAMLHQDEPDYPDTGLPIVQDYQYTIVNSTGIGLEHCPRWWMLPMQSFRDQVRKHCFDCGVPLRGYGELSQASEEPNLNTYPNIGETWHAPREQVSETHANVFKPKRRGRQVEVVANLEQLGIGRIEKFNHYLQNAKR